MNEGEKEGAWREEVNEEVNEGGKGKGGGSMEGANERLGGMRSLLPTLYLLINRTTQVTVCSIVP